MNAIAAKAGFFDGPFGVGGHGGGIRTASTQARNAASSLPFQ
jgi:hypothetical protein